MDIIPEKGELINIDKSPIQDEYIEKYLAKNDLDLEATLNADFVFIVAPTNIYSTNHNDVASSKRDDFAH